MRTLHFTNAWCPVSGGIATFYRALLAASDERGHEMRLVVPGDADRVEPAGRFGRIYFVKSPPAPFNGGYRLILPHRYLLCGSRLQRLLVEEAPDLVEISDKFTLNWMAGLLRVNGLWRVKKRPVVVGLSCERLDDNVRAYAGEGPLADRFCRFYLRWFYFPLFDHHIAVSEHTAGELHAVSDGHKVGRAVWIRPMGVSLAEMSPSRRSDEMRSWLLWQTGGGERTQVLLYAGRLAPEKNLELLIETIRLLWRDPEHDFRLLLAGSGTMRPDLERYAASAAPGRVTFLGHIPDRVRLASVYASCDMFLHPNPREPFGIALLEAMASGLPLIAPKTGGISTYAHEGNCWFAEPGAVAFASAVRSVLRDDASRARKVAAALETAKQFAWPRVCSAFLELYEEIHALASGQRTHPILKPAFVSTPPGTFPSGRRSSERRVI